MLLSNPALLDKKLEVSFNNEKISSVLAKLESKGNVSFIYETGILDLQKKINTSYKNEALGTIIKETILTEDIQIYVIGNKILLYRKSNPPQGITGKTYTIPLKAESTNNKERYKITTITVYDSVTIKCFDTIKIVTHDTVKVYDTIRIENKSKQFFKNKIKYSLLGYGSIQLHKESITFNGSDKLTTEFIKSESEKNKNFVGGLGVKFSHAKLGLEISLKLDIQNWNAEYNYINIKSDSVIVGFIEEYEWYYNKPIINSPGGHGGPERDSIKVLISKEPIYDLEKIPYQYSGKNRLSYLSVPMIISYTIAIGKKIELEPASGIEMNILLNSKGYSLANSYDLVQLEQIYKSIFFSSNTQLSLRYAITDKHKLSLYSGVKFTIGSTTLSEHFAQKRNTGLLFGLSYQYCL